MIPWKKKKSPCFVGNQNPIFWCKTEIHFCISWLAELLKSSCNMSILFLHPLTRSVIFSNKKGKYGFLSFFFLFLSEYTEFVNVSWLLAALSILTQHKYCESTGKTNLLQRNQLSGIGANGRNSKVFLTNTGKNSVQEFIKLCVLERWTALCLDFQWVSWRYLQNHCLVQWLRRSRSFHIIYFPSMTFTKSERDWRA